MTNFLLLKKTILSLFLVKPSLAIEFLARALALIGGAVLVAIIIITCVSILGRSFIFIGLGPVPGDFELVKAGSSFAIFAFLPWCQIMRGHATVDIFTNFLSLAFNRWINLIAEILMTIALIIIAWKLFDGLIAKMRYNETTFILEFPIWWAYAASLFAATIACVIAVYMVFVRFKEAATGKTHFNFGSGAVH